MSSQTSENDENSTRKSSHSIESVESVEKDAPKRMVPLTKREIKDENEIKDRFTFKNDSL